MDFLLVTFPEPVCESVLLKDTLTCVQKKQAVEDLLYFLTL